MFPFATIEDDPYTYTETPPSYSEEEYANMLLTFDIISSYGIALLIIGVVLYALNAWLLGKVFQKAGEAGWKAWIPFYSSVILLKMGNQNPWWVLAAFIPVVGIVTIVFMIIAAHSISLKFNRGAGFTVLFVFLPFVWYAILGLGPDRWNAPKLST